MSARPFLKTLSVAIRTPADAAEYMQVAFVEDGFDGLRDALKNVSEIFGIPEAEIPAWLEAHERWHAP